METVVLGIFAAALLICVRLGRSILYALVFSLFLFLGYGLSRGRQLHALLGMSLDGVRTVRNILMTFVLIGMITAFWRAGGTIPFIVSYAAQLCTPSAIVLLSFLLCCMVSVLTGTAFGSAATVGVICMTIAGSMGASPVYTGGAVLAGVDFGVRCSPLSTSALLVNELTGTDIFRNISSMIRTSVVPFLGACNQTLAIMLTDQLCQGVEPQAEKLAIGLENTVVVIAALVPWSVACAVPLESAGAPAAAVLAACYLYLLPLWNFGLALFRRKKAA